jgi:membrane glycosyltransferase
VPFCRWLQQRGLLLIPEETIAPRELTDQRDYIEELLARQQSQTRLEPVDRVILDPAFNALHVGILEATGGVGEPVGEGIRQTVLTKGPKFLRKEEVLALLADAQTLRQLHRSAWSEWPVAALHSATAFLTNTPLH